MDVSNQHLIATAAGVSKITGIAVPTIKKYALQGIGIASFINNNSYLLLIAGLGRKLSPNELDPALKIHQSKLDGYWFDLAAINSLLATIKLKIMKKDQLQIMR